MFCANCGQDISESTELCPQCGQAAKAQLMPEPARVKPKLKDVGGWLLFFCISLTILSPIAALLSLPKLALAQDINPWIIVPLILIGFSAFVGINTWMISKRAMMWLKAYFIAVGGTALFAIAYYMTLFFSAEEDASLAELMMTIFPYLRMLTWVVIWAIYFHYSKRVKATFGQNL